MEAKALRPYKAVLFDLDGTLIDSLQDIADAMNRVLETNGFPVHPYEAYRDFIGKGLRNLTSRVVPENSRDATTIEKLYHAMLQDYADHSIEKTCLYEGIPELLDALSERGIKMGILSNKADEITRKIVAGLMAPWTFQSVIGATDTLPTKRDPTSALLSARNMGLSPDNMLYAGDSGVDMQTALAAGMTPVGVTWGFRSREELLSSGATRLINHPSELLFLLDQ